MAIKTKYNIEDYADLTKANAAQLKKTEAENAVTNYGTFQYGKQDAYDRAVDTVVNMKPFQYDLNSDALYDQYKNQYQALGKLAMQDTMGQAAALTGGHGNSYAATAGNQAYQSYLTRLNDVIPQLYSLALDRYNSERDAAAGALSALSADRSTQYGEWNDQYNRLLSNRDYASNEHSNAYNLALQLAQSNYGMEQDEKNFNYQKERDAVADNQWQKSYDRGVYESDRAYNRGVYEYDSNLAYQKERDAVSDSQWQKQYNLSASKASQADRLEEAESKARVAEAKLGIADRKTYESNLVPVTRGNRGNTGNGGKAYNGRVYGSYEEYVVEMVEALEKELDLSENEINDLYTYYNV